jgi:NAD(P)-dependent dehydrogenase (short-subunit alcohol dehydrogenase family)
MPTTARPGALIIGGGTGIGFACATRLMARGHALVIAGRRKAVLEDAARRLTKIHADITTITGDGALESQARDIVETSIATLGQLDVFVNCAGIYETVAFDELDEAAWRRTISTTLDAQLFPGVAAAQAMKRSGGGRMILVSSISDSLSEPNSAAYSAAKAGVSSLAGSIAVDLGEAGITANAVAPGWIETEMTGEYTKEASRDSLRRVNVLGRMGTPDEVARVVEFLAIDAPTYLTGSTIFIDGGQTAMALLP